MQPLGGALHPPDTPHRSKTPGPPHAPATGGHRAVEVSRMNILGSVSFRLASDPALLVIRKYFS